MGQEKSKSFLQITLENTDWKDIYDEHYGKQDIDKELPKGKDLQKHLYTNSNKRWIKWRLNN